MRSTKRILGLSLLSTGIALPVASWQMFPELQENPGEFLRASRRLMRVVTSGTRMAMIYQMGGVNDESHRKSAAVLKKAIVANGGVYIKLGQVLATLDVLLPQQYTDAMASLCEHNSQSSWEDVQQVLREELGPEWRSHFSAFEEKPLKAGSIAQVHVAWLPSGEKVAVKVQHRRLAGQCPGDIRVTKAFVRAGEYLFPDMNMQWYSDEVEDNLPLELDFCLEAENARRCQAMFVGEDDFVVPAVHGALSSRRLLTMDFVTGVSVGDNQAMTDLGVDKARVAHLLAECFSRQLYIHGFVHADPHQGNLFVRKQGGKEQLVILDHGLYKDLTSATRTAYADLWRGILTQDEPLIRQSTRRLGRPSLSQAQFEEHYKMLTSMLTSKPYDTVMDEDKSDVVDRLRVTSSQAEKERIQREAMVHQDGILQVLAEVNRDLLLLFKVNDFLRTLDSRLGQPVNSFAIILKHCYNSYETQVWSTLPFYHKFNFLLAKYWSMCKLFALRLLS